MNVIVTTSTPDQIKSKFTFFVAVFIEIAQWLKGGVSWHNKKGAWIYAKELSEGVNGKANIISLESPSRIPN